MPAPIILYTHLEVTSISSGQIPAPGWFNYLIEKNQPCGPGYRKELKQVLALAFKKC
jgi:hypothetical protein